MYHPIKVVHQKTLQYINIVSMSSMINMTYVLFEGLLIK